MPSWALGPIDGGGLCHVIRTGYVMYAHRRIRGRGSHNLKKRYVNPSDLNIFGETGPATRG